jgi:hypothetical protein
MTDCVGRQIASRQQTAPPQLRSSKDATVHPHQPGASPDPPRPAPARNGRHSPAKAKVPWWRVPKGWVYGRRLVFVSERTNKRHHHLQVSASQSVPRPPASSRAFGRPTLSECDVLLDVLSTHGTVTTVLQYLIQRCVFQVVIEVATSTS